MVEINLNDTLSDVKNYIMKQIPPCYNLGRML